MERNQNRPIAALFDFDGVVCDTESQYTLFYHAVGEKYLGVDDFEQKIKGQTLAHILTTHFPGREADQQEIVAQLNAFEAQMSYDYVEGFLDFIRELKGQGVLTAVVTSSNDLKMQAVYRVHPELSELFDRILTAEQFRASKPDPDCFLLGMRLFGTDAAHTFVFEDSLNGLKAGMNSGAHVVALTTSHPAEALEGLCHTAIRDFSCISCADLLKML